MKFHEYTTYCEDLKRCGQIGKNETPRTLFERRVDPGKVKDNIHGYQQLMADMFWWECCRPYYKVWPSIVRPLTRLSLDIKLRDLPRFTLRVLLIRFVAGSEPIVDEAKVHFVFLSSLESRSGKAYLNLFLVIEESNKETRSIGFFLPLWGDETVEERITKITEGEDTLVVSFATRISLTVLLLADDPSVITPDVLSKDRNRYKTEVDETWKKRAVARAHRRGAVGWNIGAEYEVCPHYRRPHFGIRYTGKGKAIPKIVPIRGAVVHRSKLAKVPTGYILPDGQEVEP